MDKMFRRHKRTVGRRWRMDETYITIKGQWKYLYRAVNTAGQSILFLYSYLAFFRKAIRYHSGLQIPTIDKSGANMAALTTLSANKPAEEKMTIRLSKYQNNSCEVEHRSIKRRMRPITLFYFFYGNATELLFIVKIGSAIPLIQYSEWVPVNGYVNFTEADKAIINHITGYYSETRPHQYNGELMLTESE